MKLENFCKSKNTVNRTNWQPTDWENICTNSTSNRGLISKIYKKLKNLITIKPNNPFKKWDIDLNQELTTEKSPVAEKHLKKCPKSLVIREMKIKMKLRFHLTPIRIAKIKNLRGQNKLVRMWRKRNTPPLLVGMQIGTISLQINLEIPPKLEIDLPGDSEIPLLGIYPKDAPPCNRDIRVPLCS
jgi:hypothetical protein